MKHKTFLGLLATSALAPALAQPSKPIRVIVPFVAGGPIDVTVRVLAERTESSLGATIIDNRPGRRRQHRCARGGARRP